jgi:hypothetical protein
MIISLEIEVNPGESSLFVAEVKIEKNNMVTQNWWGLWLSWWLLKDWQHWLWAWEVVRENRWFTFQWRVLGFEINWQRRKGR